MMKEAEEMGVTTQYAVNCRRRFLTEELERIDLELAWYEDYEGAPDSEYFALTQVSQLGEDKARIHAELRRLKKVTLPQTGITDEDIDRARESNITSVIEFTKGKAIAFCHEDRNPSMYHATRLNLAICPVCDKKFDAIGVLMQRDGYSFQSAVRQLI